MNRYVIAPLIAALAFTGSGFLNALEDATEASAALARASASAPRTTEAAAREVAPLPDIAVLTTRQAQAFEGLADALDLSLVRVEHLATLLDEQEAGLHDLALDLERLPETVSCIHDRLEVLTGASRRTSPAISAIAEVLRGLIGSQEKAIRHLRSINRKLAALGVIATAGGVEAPPPPPDAPAPAPGAPPAGRDC